MVGIGVYDHAVVFAIAAAKRQYGVRINGVGNHELAQANGNVAAGFDQVVEIGLLGHDQVRHQLPLGFREGRQECVARFGRQVDVDGIVGVAHRGRILEVERAEVGALPLGTEIHVGLDRTRVPAVHLAGVGHDGHADLRTQVQALQGIREILRPVADAAQRGEVV